MSIIVEFFVAPNDTAAAAVREAGPDKIYESATYGNFDVALAMTEWESILTDRNLDELIEAGEPRFVAGEEDSAMVFVASRGLQDALAGADESRLVRTGEMWIQERAEEGEVFDPELVRELVTDVARLARTAAKTGQFLYCWMG